MFDVKRAVLMRVTFEELRRALRVPDDVKIVNLRYDDEYCFESVVLRLETDGEKLLAVPNGGRVPHVSIDIFKDSKEVEKGS